MEPVMSFSDQIELNNNLSKHGQSMSEPANLVLPFLIYNLEGAERDEFTNDMPFILKMMTLSMIRNIFIVYIMFQVEIIANILIYFQ